MFVKTLLSMFVFLGAAFAEVTEEQTDRNIEVYNPEVLELGLKGYDPVSYFPEGGAAAQQGQEEITYTYGGIKYHFASEENRKLFSESPTKYEPTYGGWCAWAMVHGQTIDINPEYFTVEGNRAHFFVNPRAKRNFDRRVRDHEVEADQNWFEFSGEQPRK